MNIEGLLAELKDCPCGREHTVDIKAVEIGHGLKEKTADILKENGFPTNILVVADKNTLSASEGILEVLEKGGITCKLKLYENFREPLMEYVHEIELECEGVEGILSVGTGSLNDVCRKAALTCDKEFAIFATAPSMDGFASGTSPIIENGIKSTLPARQPSILIGDTQILAAAPAELKSAGFGDIIGKFTALVDWRVSHVLSGEYYCERIAELVRTALRQLISMADRVTPSDEETAGFIMETLVLTGLAMKLADVSRPASGAEHMISHFWGMRKLAVGQHADYHGKKVGVATMILADLYHKMAQKQDIDFREDEVDWDAVYRGYGEAFVDYVKAMNIPSATENVTPESLRAAWPEICRIVEAELPTYEELLAIMERAGAATQCHEIDIDEPLAWDGVDFHTFMRHKITLSRLIYMTDIDTRKMGLRSLT